MRSCVIRTGSRFNHHAEAILRGRTSSLYLSMFMFLSISIHRYRYINYCPSPIYIWQLNHNLFQYWMVSFLLYMTKQNKSISIYLYLYTTYFTCYCPHKSEEKLKCTTTFSFETTKYLRCNNYVLNPIWCNEMNCDGIN